jgi:hypothetical protein
LSRFGASKWIGLLALAIGRRSLLGLARLSGILLRQKAIVGELK